MGNLYFENRCAGKFKSNKKYCPLASKSKNARQFPSNVYSEESPLLRQLNSQFHLRQNQLNTDLLWPLIRGIRFIFAIKAERKLFSESTHRALLCQCEDPGFMRLEMIHSLDMQRNANTCKAEDAKNCSFLTFGTVGLNKSQSVKSQSPVKHS